MTASIARVLAELERWGMLLASDPALPSVSSVVAGRPIRGSWWADESGREIYSVLTALEDARGLAFLKLVAGKVTILHQRLEPPLLTLATCGEPWQRDGLSPLAVELLAVVEAEGTLRLDRARSIAPRQALARATAEMESRLLAYCGQEHTERGAHERVLASWRHWASTREIRRSEAPLDACKQAFESVLAAWREDRGASSGLPWTGRPRGRARPRPAK